MISCKEEILELLGGRIFQYAVISTKDINFSPELLKTCEKNSCGNYNKYWTCPPAAGPIEKHMEKIQTFSHAFVFTSKGDLDDPFDFEGMMKANDYHSKITAEMHERLGKTNPVYGAGTCKICKDTAVSDAAISDKCAYPEACRFPEKIFPAIEAAGINVTELSRIGGINYNNGKNTVTYFSMILYNE